MRMRRRAGTMAALGLVGTLVLAGCSQSRMGGTSRAAQQRGPCGDSQRNVPQAADGVSEEEVRSTRATHVEELLSGRVAGVRVVTHPGGGFSVRIRGTRSILGNNEPLYVVDGMPVDVGQRGMLGLSPWDVECIEVLKDAGSTGFYGVRGANGVVLITTRRPG